MTVLAKHVMSSRVLTIQSNCTYKEALQVLVENHITGLAVVNELGILVGVISMFDLLKAHLYLKDFETTYFEASQIQRVLETGTLSVDSIMEAYVADFMSRDVVSVGPETTRDEIIDILKQHKIHRVIVADPQSNKPLGVVTPLDLI